jgi:beta-fructofuranosidase
MSARTAPCRRTDDPKLTHWVKSEVPWLALPPPSMDLGGWRDPYIIGRPGQDGQDLWTLIIGSGINADGGTGTN